VTAVYQRDVDRFEVELNDYEMDTSANGSRFISLSADEADELLYDLEHAVWERQRVKGGVG
jgi:hypothetical protein